MVVMIEFAMFFMEDADLLSEVLHKQVFCRYRKTKYEKSKNISIVRSKYGKPQLLIDGKKCGMEFNISHTKGAGVVVFSDHPIGVDIEAIKKGNLGIAKRFFLPKEIAYIWGADDEQICNDRFYEIWVKKEAFLKCRGIGLHGGLKSVNVLDEQYVYGILEAEMERYAVAIYTDL